MFHEKTLMEKMFVILLSEGTDVKTVCIIILKNIVYEKTRRTTLKH